MHRSCEGNDLSQTLRRLCSRLTCITGSLTAHGSALPHSEELPVKRKNCSMYRGTSKREQVCVGSETKSNVHDMVQSKSWRSAMRWRARHKCVNGTSSLVMHFRPWIFATVPRCKAK